MGMAAIVLAVGLAVPTVALESGTDPLFPQVRALSFTELDRAEALARYGHPNEMWRYRALRALKLEQAGRAAEYFQRAGLYADKFSQHALSLLHWHGIGVERDRAQAYVWADLAAERGYRDLLLLREKMWLEMSAAQRAQALQLGEATYREYGDAAAKPRMEWAMRRAFAAITGSRVGATTDRVKFAPGGAVEGLGLAPQDFFADRRWSADRYWRGQDRQWEAKVIVLPPEPVPDAPAAEGSPD
jgi:hypothetical protein